MINGKVITIDGQEALQQSIGTFAEVDRTSIFKQNQGNFEQITSHDALVNTRDGHCSSVVSRRYGIVSHNTIIACVNRICQEMNLPIKGKIIDESDSMSASIYFDNVLIPDDAKGIKLGFRLTNSYDRSQSLKIDTFGYRLVCSNGMVVSKVIQNGCASIKKHVGTISQEEIEGFLRSYFNSVVQCTEALRLKVQESQVISYNYDFVTNLLLKYLKSEKYLRGVCDLLKIDLVVVERDEKKFFTFAPQDRTITQWELYNAITAYATHQKHSITGEERLQEIAQAVLLTR